MNQHAEKHSIYGFMGVQFDLLLRLMRDILNFIVSQAANSLTFTTKNIQSVALTLTRTL